MPSAQSRPLITMLLACIIALPLAGCRRADTADSGSADATAEAAAGATAAASPIQAPPPLDGGAAAAGVPGDAGAAGASTGLEAAGSLASTVDVSQTAQMGPIELQGAAFTLDGAPYTLTNGRAEDAAKFLAMGLGPWGASGDLNGDGVPDAVGVLVVSGGGSGSFSYLLPGVNTAGTVKAANPYFLGDRVKINGVAVTGGQIELDVVTHGPTDPMCCPSQNAKWNFMVVGDQVVVTSQAGPPTLAAP